MEGKIRIEDAVTSTTNTNSSSEILNRDLASSHEDSSNNSGAVEDILMGETENVQSPSEAVTSTTNEKSFSNETLNFDDIAPILEDSNMSVRVEENQADMVSSELADRNQKNELVQEIKEVAVIVNEWNDVDMNTENKEKSEKVESADRDIVLREKSEQYFIIEQETVKEKEKSNDSGNSQMSIEIDLQIKQYQEELKALTKDESSYGFESSHPDESEAASNSEKRASTPESSSSSSSPGLLTNDESTLPVPTRKSSVPYYHMPKPDLHEFLAETGKIFSIAESDEKTPVCPQRTFEPKNTGDIVFDLKGDSKSNLDTPSRTEQSMYEKVKSINNLQDSTPGAKKTLLNDCLKKEIKERKIFKFNQRKENEKLDNELEFDKNNYESKEQLEEAIDSIDKEQVDYDSYSSGDDENVDAEIESKSVKNSESDLNTDDDDNKSDADDNDDKSDADNDDNKGDADDDDDESVTLTSECERSPDVETIKVVLPKSKKDEDCDDLIPKKAKKVKVLDSDSEDCELVYEGKIEAVEHKTKENTHSEGCELVYKDKIEAVEHKTKENTLSEGCELIYGDKIEAVEHKTKENTHSEENSRDSSIEILEEINAKKNPHSEDNMDSTDSPIQIVEDKTEDPPSENSMDSPVEIVGDVYPEKQKGSENGYELDHLELASSSIPSFQPHGGFVCESQKEEEEIDAIKEAETKIMQLNKIELIRNRLNKNYSILAGEKESYEDSDSNLEAPPKINENDADGQKFGFTFDNPPISQNNNRADVFSTQEITDVCSGKFKNDMPKETQYSQDDEGTNAPMFSEHEESAKDFVTEALQYSSDDESMEEDNNIKNITDKNVPSLNTEEFFDNEAVLSGDDESMEEDEQEPEDNDKDFQDNYIDDSVKENSTSQARLYHKQERDKDAMTVKALQEQYCPDDELKSGRERNYAWDPKGNQLHYLFGYLQGLF